MPKPPADPVLAYAQDVVSGKTVAGRLVKLAAARHLHDLQNGTSRGLRWHLPSAMRYINFCKDVLRLNGGQFEGLPFILQPWQAFVGGSLFGWLNAEGFRRYRTAFVLSGKGSGKSPSAASTGLYMLVADGEQRAEVYAGASKLVQAQVLFRDATAMVKMSGLNRVCVTSGAEDREWNIAFHKTHSWFRAIGSDKKTQSGPRPHCALLDELHEHPDASMVDMMRAGTKFRQQPLIFEITNAPEDSEGVCANHQDYSRKLLDGFDKPDGLHNDAFFAYVCQLDPCEKCASEGQSEPIEGCEDCDDWRDEAVWPKTNPSLPLIPGYPYLREQVQEAQGMPTKQATVKRLAFCLRTRSGAKAIDMQAWEACGDARQRITDGSLKGKPCHGAIDIGSTSDFTAFSQLFPHDDAEVIEVPIDPDKPDDGKMKIMRRSYTLIPHFWLPRSRAPRDKALEDVIDNWIRFGLITETPGNVTDYDMVIEDIKKMDKVSPFTDISLDYGFQGAYFATKLQNYFGEKKIKTVRQGIISMNVPFRELLELIKLHRLHHGKHPVMSWQMSNVVAETRGGLIKPDKDASIEKIDICTAACMALSSAMVAADSGGWYKPGIVSGREFDE